MTTMSPLTRSFAEEESETSRFFERREKEHDKTVICRCAHIEIVGQERSEHQNKQMRGYTIFTWPNNANEKQMIHWELSTKGSFLCCRRG